MTPEEIEDLKAVISARMNRALQAYVGTPLSAISVSVVKAHVEQILRDVGAAERRPILDLLDVEVKAEGTVAHISMKPKEGLDQADYRRAIAFLTNEEFW